jgi:hypothetical protein
MIDALKEALPMAIGLAFSPFPLIAIIILLMTPKAKSNSLWFLLGWMLGIYFIGLLVLLIPGLGTDQGEPTVLSGSIRIIAGAILLIFAFKSWLKRPKPGDEIVTPKLFLTIDSFGLKKSMVTGFLFSAANVKNMAFSAAGAARIYQSLSEDGNTFATLAVFALIGSLILMLPVMIYVIAGTRIEPTFLVWKKWLIKNNKILLVIILSFIGLILIKAGLQIIV